eukprot:scaffold11739_cov107-Cylindrotheca_fusiformis.AAC.2
MTRRAAARTGQKSGLPLRPWPITSPRTPFFCEVNSRVTNVAERRRWGGAERVSRRRPPRKKVVSVSRKGEVSERWPVYSPGRRRKKKAKHSMSAMHLAASEAAGACEAPMMCSRSGTGTGFTREGVGVSRGSGDPSSAAVWPTLRKAPSTVRDRTCRRVVLTCPWRNLVGSGSPSSVQKSSHLDQWARVCWAREGTTPRELSCDAERRSRRKESTAAGDRGAKRRRTSIIGHAVVVTGNVVAEFGVAVEALGGEIVSARLDGTLPDVEAGGSDCIMQEPPQQFKLGVVEGAVGVVEANKLRRNISGEGAAPKDGPRCAGTAADGLTFAVEDDIAIDSRDGGVVREPDAASAKARGIMGAYKGWCSGHQFGQAGGPAAKVGMQPAEVIECSMKTGMEAKTGSALSRPDSSLEVAKETTGTREC